MSVTSLAMAACLVASRSRTNGHEVSHALDLAERRVGGHRNHDRLVDSVIGESALEIEQDRLQLVRLKPVDLIQTNMNWSA